jgi:hypothetical protein
LLTRGHALVGGQAIDLALDDEQSIDALDRLDGDRCLVEPRKIEEVTPRMRPASGLDNRRWLAARVIEPVEPGIGVRLHQSRIASQMLFRMFGAAIGRVEEDDRRWIAAAKGPVVAHIGP